MTTATANPAKVITSLIRGSFVNIWTAKKDKWGREDFNMMICVPKSDKATLEKIKMAMQNAINEKWGDNRPRKLTIPLKDGDNPEHLPNSAQSGQEPYAGHFFFTARNKEKPGIIDANREEIIEPGVFKSGDYFRVSVNAFAYDNEGQGVSFGLNNVQYLKEGKPLGAPRIKAEDDFGDYLDGSEGSALSNSDEEWL